MKKVRAEERGILKKKRQETSKPSTCSSSIFSVLQYEEVPLTLWGSIKDLPLFCKAKIKGKKQKRAFTIRPQKWERREKASGRGSLKKKRRLFLLVVDVRVLRSFSRYVIEGSRVEMAGMSFTKNKQVTIKNLIDVLNNVLESGLVRGSWFGVE